MFQENVRYLKFQSNLLKGAPLVESHTRLVPVLLPEGYSEKKRYPTIWMLDGYLGNGRSLLSESGFLGESLGSQLIRLMNEELIPPSIFVFPDPTTRFGGSQYLNSQACGPFMDHLTDELIPLIESKFSCIAESRGRVICGHSSGGYGALMTSMLKPGYFDYCIASAADSAFDLSMMQSFPIASMRFQKCGGPEAFLKYFAALPRPEKCSKDDFHAFMTVAMATCYSPNLSKKGLWCDLPFDSRTGELIPEVWARWCALDPCHAVSQSTDALRQLKWLHLDCGSEDEFCAQFGHRRMAQKLKAAEIEHLHTEFPGGHSGTSKRWEFRFTELAPFLRSFSGC
jgi:enterochelin esterase-like enzyme